MPSDNYNTVALSLPSAALLAISQTAIGCGIGILLADKISENKRTTAAVAMLFAGDCDDDSRLGGGGRRSHQWTAIKTRGEAALALYPRRFRAARGGRGPLTLKISPATILVRFSGGRFKALRYDPGPAVRFRRNGRMMPSGLSR